MKYYLIFNRVVKIKLDIIKFWKGYGLMEILFIVSGSVSR